MFRLSLSARPVETRLPAPSPLACFAFSCPLVLPPFSAVSPSAHRFVVTLLDSKSAEMCYSTCGVLTNLALDPLTRAKLSQEGAAAK